MKKSKLFFNVILLMLIMISVSGFSSGGHNLPLAEGEVLLKERVLEDKNIEAFIELDGAKYRKIFTKDKTKENETSEFTLINSEAVVEHGKGLSVEDNPKSGEVQLKLEQFFKDKKPRSGILPSYIDYTNSEYLPEVRSQGSVNSCVGWSLGYYLRTYQQARDLKWDVKDEDGYDRHDRVFSSSFIYNQINGGQNNPVYFSDATNILKSQGAVTQSIFNEDYDYTQQPNYSVIEKAYPHRIMDDLSMNITIDNLEHVKKLIKEALVAEELPVLGIFTGDNWSYPYEYQGDSFIVSDDYLGRYGGHAVVIVGYDDDITTPEGRGAFKIINSWGNDWADDGYAYITYEAFKQHGYYLGFFLDLENDEKDVEDIQDIKVDILSTTEAKYTWEPSINATKYLIYDESYNLIDEVYDSTEYTETSDTSQIKTRYIKAVNDVFESDLFEFTVESKQQEITKKLDFDRANAKELKTIVDQPTDKEWTISFNREFMKGNYLRNTIFVVDKDNYIQDITIESEKDSKTLRIKPSQQGYKSGEKYTIVIRNVIDINGNGLNQTTIMDFITQNSISSYKILQEVIESDGRVFLRINNKLYQYIGNASDIQNFIGMSIAFNVQTLNGVDYIYDVVIT